MSKTSTPHQTVQRVGTESADEVISKDGTRIAFSQWGDGSSPLVLVDGALCHRSFGPMPKLAPLLARDFTVVAYDRRGRGDSGDTAPYSVERELDDLEAVIDAVGGSACVFGVSSGAALALEAANRLSSVEKLGVYEAPFIVDGSRPPLTNEWLAELDRLVAADRRGDAVKLFMKFVGTPSLFVAVMPWTPVWSKLRAVAHTLPYDLAIVKDHQRGNPLTVEEFSSVAAPTLVLAGGKSPAWMRHGMQALAPVLGDARLRTLAGQTHMVKPAVVAPVITDFFTAS